MDRETDNLISVPPRGFVRLVDVMGDDRAVVQAARVSYGEGTKTVREDAALIDYLMRHEHWSPFEMVVFKFHVKAPIFVARQWFRHRTASVNEVSGRYSVLKEEFYLPLPEEWRRAGSTNKQGSVEGPPEGWEAEDHQKVEDFMKGAYEVYQELLSKGVSREMARTVLPLATYTEFYWKQDLRNLLHFIRLRTAPEAQKEIRAYAEALSVFVKSITPLSWASFAEHHLGGARFSSTELEVLSEMVDKEEFAKRLRERGLSVSRVREALEKLGGFDDKM